MSQIIKNLASGPVPPEVATSYVGDAGTAVPLANVLLIKSGTITGNNVTGIRVFAGTVLTGNANEVEVLLTNTIISGSISTVDTQTITLISFNLPSEGVYAFKFVITSQNVNGDNGGAYFVYSGVRLDIPPAVKLGKDIINRFEDPILSTALIEVVASGSSVQLRITGVAGETIDWSAKGYYQVET